MPLPVTRVRAAPWIIVFQLALTLHRHWRFLTPDERRRLALLVKKSQGSPTKLTAPERAEMRRLVRKLEPFTMARAVVPIGKRAMTGRR